MPAVPPVEILEVKAIDQFQVDAVVQADNRNDLNDGRAWDHVMGLAGAQTGRRLGFRKVRELVPYDAEAQPIPPVAFKSARPAFWRATYEFGSV
jgi:hypothetical protein